MFIGPAGCIGGRNWLPYVNSGLNTEPRTDIVPGGAPTGYNAFAVVWFEVAAWIDLSACGKEVAVMPARRGRSGT